MNTHPDYMVFENLGVSDMEYPVAHYMQFFDHLKTHYAGKFYHALPSAVAAVWKRRCESVEFASQSVFAEGEHEECKRENLLNPAFDLLSSPHLSIQTAPPPRRDLRVAMLTYSFYESDNRVRRYAETLVKKGHSVDIISLRGEKQEDYAVLKGVKIYRVQKRTRDEKGKFTYLARMLEFFLKSAMFLIRNHFRNRYDLIHVHSVPDFEVFAALIPKLTGSKIILDIHDPVPDFFLAKFKYNKNSFYFKALKLVERYSCHYADHVITVSDYWRVRIKNRSELPDQKITAIVNYPDTEIFNIGNHKARPQSTGGFTILYPGTLNKHCGLHIVLEAIALLKSTIPDIRLHIYGKGNEENALRLMVTKLGLKNCVVFHDTVSIDEVPKLMVNADIGIALLTGDNTYSKQALNVKLFEFLAMGLPAIATKVASIERYLGDGVVMLSKPNDPEDVARCINELYSNVDKREELRKAGLIFSEKRNWHSESVRYEKIIEEILGSLNKGMLA
jgi:glycosyltransferase involved in cell wall biosynthesis